MHWWVSMKWVSFLWFVCLNSLSKWTCSDGSEAVFYMGAMLEHSCSPNARFCIRSLEQVPSLCFELSCNLAILEKRKEHHQSIFTGQWSLRWIELDLERCRGNQLVLNAPALAGWEETLSEATLDRWMASNKIDCHGWAGDIELLDGYLFGGVCVEGRVKVKR